jgi:hypothetical protein
MTVLVRTRRGQALVETAIMMPVILILLLGAIDFGRLFFTWAGLHQAARIGANHASIDSTTTSAEIPAIIQTETDVISCDPGSLSADLIYTSGGTQVATPAMGDYARVTLTCEFSLLTPLAGVLFGDPIPMTAISSFPVRTGCIDCGPGSGSSSPPPPPEQCRTVPEMGGMSVAGAQLAWQSAGFAGTFDAGGADDHETVDPDSIAVDPVDPACVDPLAIFSASVTVGTLPPDEGDPGCELVPNLIGLPIADARAAWAAGAFTGASFEPPEPDADPDAVVEDQTTSPTASDPGVSCLVPGTDVTEIAVETGDPWPDPPEAPCQVPHMIDLNRPQGQGAWYGKGFVANTFSPTNGNWKIKWQSLVGFTWVPCNTPVTVDNKAP